MELQLRRAQLQDLDPLATMNKELIDDGFNPYAVQMTLELEKDRS